jgi:hypothetical protein
MKYQADTTQTKWHVDEMANGQNGNFVKCQVDEIAS